MDKSDFIQTLKYIYDEGAITDLNCGMYPAHVVDNKSDDPIEEAMFFTKGLALYYGGLDSMEPVPVCDIPKVRGVSFRGYEDHIDLYIDLPSARIRFVHRSHCAGDEFMVHHAEADAWVVGDAAKDAMRDLIHKPDSLGYSIDALFVRAMWESEDMAPSPEAVHLLERRLSASSDEGDPVASAKYLALAEHAMDEQVREFFDEGYARTKVMENNAVKVYGELIWDLAKWEWSEDEVEDIIEQIEMYVIQSSLADAEEL